MLISTAKRRPGPSRGAPLAGRSDQDVGESPAHRGSRAGRPEPGSVNPPLTGPSTVTTLRPPVDPPPAGGLGMSGGRGGGERSARGGLSPPVRGCPLSCTRPGPAGLAVRGPATSQWAGQRSVAGQQSVGRPPRARLVRRPQSVQLNRPTRPMIGFPSRRDVPRPAQRPADRRGRSSAGAARPSARMRAAPDCGTTVCVGRAARTQERTPRDPDPPDGVSGSPPSARAGATVSRRNGSQWAGHQARASAGGRSRFS
jgi:hypothetical protein